MSISAYIALGSNLGDRRAYLDRALQALQDRPGIVVAQVSSYRETEPVGGPPGQGPYLNAAAALQTDLEPEALLQVLLDVERSLGRVRGEPYGPRTIDLDLLFFDALIRDSPNLTLPHPRLHERLFVLEPLAEIAPEWRHPVRGQTIRALLHEQRSRPALAQTPCPERMEQSAVLPLRAERELAGLRALVTGSTSGIGAAISQELAAAGAAVIIHGRRRLAAEAVAERVRSRGVHHAILLADLSEAEECRRLVNEAWDCWQGLDIWVNNAGADTLTGPAAHWTFERKLQELLTIDLQATVLLSRLVGQRMQDRGGGVVLNMGWDQAETGMEGDSGQLFGATKAAVMAFSKSLALSLAPQVRVNCLAPGWIRTGWGASASARWQERVRRETPLGRWGTPADVAAAARWLVSPAAGFLTGQIVRVNGGAVR